MYNITATVEKENEAGLMTYESARLVELGGQIAHTISCRQSDLAVQHCNVVIEVKKMDSEIKLAISEEKSIKIRQATEQGYAMCEIGGAVDLNYPTSQTRRGRVIENGKICPTLTVEYIPNVIELGNPKFYNFVYKIDGEWWLIRIRKLTPKECWRLMGFYDEDFEKAEKVCSNTQLYKQSGNSIVCDCLEAIFSQLNIKGVTPWNDKIKENKSNETV